MPVRVWQEIQTLPRRAERRVALGRENGSATRRPNSSASASLQRLPFFRPFQFFDQTGGRHEVCAFRRASDRWLNPCRAGRCACTSPRLPDAAGHARRTVRQTRSPLVSQVGPLRRG
jgi:hypothetical protein